jgi:hypothetical protein
MSRFGLATSGRPQISCESFNMFVFIDMKFGDAIHVPKKTNTSINFHNRGEREARAGGFGGFAGPAEVRDPVAADVSPRIP